MKVGSRHTLTFNGGIKLPTPLSSAWTARKLSGQSTNQTTWLALNVAA